MNEDQHPDQGVNPDDATSQNDQQEEILDQSTVDDSQDDFDLPVSQDGETITRVTGMYREWFLDYASYVILERAVPAIEDGFKPVQRRIMHSMKDLDDGRYNKVANIVGHTMQYHPHGDASIADAMVQLGQKDLLIDTQGNWGNILTGDRAAASRYIEARISKFGLDVVFNPKITKWQSSYDGRRKEPINLPVMFPLLLAQGGEGIAVGLSTKILPHNFIELIDASVKHLQGKRFTIFPDFPTGGIIDVTNYNGELVYVIGFKPRKAKSKYSGKLFITDESYAVIKADYKFAKGKRGEKINLRLILGVKYVEDINMGTIIFEQHIDGFYSPKYVKEEEGHYFYVHRPIKFIENSTAKRKTGFDFLIEGSAKARSEFYVLKNTPLDKSSFDSYIEPKNFPYQKLDRYDPSIWKSHNAIEPLEEMKKFKSTEN